jgi:diketogulonate reductase-like aldo/keto reductase
MTIRLRSSTFKIPLPLLFLECLISRSVGVSNFGINHLEGLKNAGRPTPSVNQIELHPWQPRRELVKYCRKNGIAVEGYSPLVKARCLDDEEITKLASK